MSSRDRQRMLSALGLVDWQPRRDGPLVDALQSGFALLPPSPAGEQANTSGSMSSAREAVEPASEANEETSWPDDADADRAAAFQNEAFVDELQLRSYAAASSVRDMDWNALEAWLAEQDYRGAQRPVFGVGARDAAVLIVGEAPGANEDAQGVPFVGRAGQLLDRMLFAIGCSRETNVYITNICKFRPPNNRDPRPEEVAADWPVLERQIELMDPKLVVAVGRVAAQTLLDSKESLGKLRGRLHPYPRRELDVLVTYHPAFLLRSPQQKSKAWEDLKRIAAHIGKARNL